jgi:hypothetical protein
MLLRGYFEALDSERAIAWRSADSLSTRNFRRLELHERGDENGARPRAAGV